MEERKSKRNWEDVINLYLKKTAAEVVDWVHPAVFGGGLFRTQ
jgi:hypothetical protein